MSAALLDAVRLHLAEHGGEPTPARVAAALRAHGRLLGDSEVLGVVAALRSELVGAGPLEPLLADPDVTDILVNAPDQVWIDRGRGLERSGIRFADTAAVRRLAQRLATTAGRRLDDARPWVDARLPDGTRLHAVLPPVVVGSPCLSLRVVRARAFTLGELVSAGTLDTETAVLLRAVLDARLSFMISGGTGSGKTTLLSCLLGLVDPAARIVLAEDSAELRPDHPHVVRLETRPANQEGAGHVTLRDLVRQALRMRPDRLVVGEVRGAEVTGPAGRPQHRPRGRVRHCARQCGRRRPRPPGGPRLDRGTRSGRPAQPVGGGPVARRPPGPGHCGPCAGSPRSMCCGAAPTVWSAPCPPSCATPVGRLDRGPGWQRLTALCAAGAS